MKLSQELCQEAAQQATEQSGYDVVADGVSAFNAQYAAARFRLTNGLTIVLMPMHQTPVFAYQTWFRVGSKNEDPERTGLAHLFEHLMFKGTKRFPAGVFDREMERRGTQTNAATWVDWTYYTQALAARADNLEAVVEFEVDRMTGLNLNEETFRSELEVVKNERRMSVEDSVGGALNEKLCELVFTEHPYRWPTIGSMAHLRAATLDDLERFYQTYYAPNNATVVVTGAIDLHQTLTLLASKYGPLKASPIPTPSHPIEPAQTAPRHAVIKRPVVASQVLIAFRACAQNHPDFAALELLSDTLASGDTARLYQRLVVEDELATDIGCFLAPFSEPGLFEISITLRDGATVEAVCDAVQEELERISHGISQDEFEKARNSLELSYLEGLRDVEGCAESLGHYETNFLDFGMAFTSARRFSNLLPTDLARVAKATFSPTARTVVVAES